MKVNPRFYSKQQGAVLIISMVLLLVMSLIGLSSVVSSTLQEKMAGNSQQSALARYAAESGIRAAEVYIATNIKSKSDLVKFNGSTLGLYSTFPVPSILFEGDLAKQSADLGDVAKSTAWVAANSVEVDDLSSKVQGKKPRYAIEYVGRRSKSGSDFWTPEGGTLERGAPYIFKITAIGWGRDTNVYSVLQSHFMTGDGVGIFEYED